MPKPATFDVKEVYAPVKTQVNGCIVTDTNMFDFTNLDEYQISWYLEKDGDILQKGEFVADIPPHTSKQFEFEFDNIKECVCGTYLDISIKDKNGFEIAHQQHNVNVPRQKMDVSVANTKCINNSNPNFIEIKKGNAYYEINKHTGMLRRINNKLHHESRLSVWRAPTDNDRHIKRRWGLVDGDNLMGENYNILCNKIYLSSVDRNKVIFTGSLSGISRMPFFKYRLIYTIMENGALMIELTGNISERCEYLPRLGFEFYLNNKNPKFEYFGKGPMENYVDMCHHTRVGKHISTADEEYVSYVVPQEHGNHTKTSYVYFENGLKIKSDGYFDFNVSKYTIEQLEKAKHNNELEENQFSVLRVDYKCSGIGSGSCGPQLMDKYKLNDKEINFKFYISNEGD